jgi:excisionase family DNA binding protein
MTKPKLSLTDTKEVAETLHISQATIRRWAAEKKLTKIKLGRRVLFDSSEIARMVDKARCLPSDSVA